MAAGFIMHADPVGSGISKCRNELVGVLDHQVAIERQAGGFAQALDDRRSNGDVGNKMPIHDVDVDDRATASLGCGNVICQVGEISREDGWKQFDHRVLRGSVFLSKEMCRPDKCISEVQRTPQVKVPRLDSDGETGGLVSHFCGKGETACSARSRLKGADSSVSQFLIIHNEQQGAIGIGPAHHHAYLITLLGLELVPLHHTKSGFGYGVRTYLERLQPRLTLNK